MTWGDRDYGGDSSEVQDQLKESSRFKELEFYQSLKVARLLRSWQMAQLVTWGAEYLGATAGKYKISSRESSRFKQLAGHLLLSCQMDRL